jgi:hypothetical protein
VNIDRPTSRILFVSAALSLVSCAEHQTINRGERPPIIISRSLIATKQQRDYTKSSDFRERLGKKIFDYERAKPTFRPPRLTQPGFHYPISRLPENVLSFSDASQLRRAGITDYSIYWEDYWWGRSYWFYFYYRNGNFFSYDVHTDIKKNAVIYD